MKLYNEEDLQAFMGIVNAARMQGYEAARKQAAALALGAIKCKCGSFCECYGRSTLQRISKDIIAMQPSKEQP